MKAAGRSSRGALLRTDHVESTTPRRKGEVPDRALRASLGCGNPTALTELKAGETVLDLASGGGIDVLLSARRVDARAKETDAIFVNGFIRAMKPAAASCCGPSCCDSRADDRA